MIQYRRRSLAVREALWGYAMVAPLLVGFGVFFYLALVASLLIGFTEWDVLTPPRWVGLGNYARLFHNPLFYKALWNTTRYTLMSVPVGQVISLTLALALNTRIRFRSLYRLVFFLPLLTMPVAIAVVWKWIYNPDFGLLSQLLRPLGFPRLAWLGEARWAMPALVVIALWRQSGYGMVIFLAGLQNIPCTYYEAAQVDGANRWQQFWYITLPLLTPTLFFSIVTALIDSFQVFDLVFVMTRGGPLNSTRTLVYNIYEDAFRYFHMGYATATSWVLFIIILAVTVVQWRAQRKWVHYIL
jgi:multiple sugar transport system permease protein